MSGARLLLASRPASQSSDDAWGGSGWVTALIGNALSGHVKSGLDFLA